MQDHNEHTEQELPEMPGRSGGFTVPASYFGQLPNRLLERVSDSGFRVPDSYFDELTTRIGQSVQQAEGKKKVIPFTPRLRWVAGIAAGLALASGLLFMNRPAANHADLSASLDKISDEEIVAYVDAADLSDTKVFEFALNNYDKATGQAEDAYILDNADEALMTEEL